MSAPRARPSAVEVAQTVVELAPSGTLSAVSPDGWPLGVGARFVSSRTAQEEVKPGRLEVERDRVAVLGAAPGRRRCRPIAIG